MTPLCYTDGDPNSGESCSVNIELEAGDYINVKVVSSGGACINGDTSGMTGFLGNLIKSL